MYGVVYTRTENMKRGQQNMKAREGRLNSLAYAAFVSCYLPSALA